MSAEDEFESSEPGSINAKCDGNPTLQGTRKTYPTFNGFQPENLNDSKSSGWEGIFWESQEGNGLAKNAADLFL